MKKKIALVAGFAAVASVLALGLVTGVTGKAENREPSGDMLQTPNREQLKICIQPINLPSFDSSATQKQVTQAMPDVAKAEKWATSGYDKGGSPAIDRGCPADPYLLRPGVEVIDGRPSGDSPIPEVQEASQYKLFIFVLPSGQLNSSIKGNLDVRYAPQEAVCEGHTCRTVTAGIYLTADELSNHDFLVDWIQRGLSLKRPVDIGPPDNQQGQPR